MICVLPVERALSTTFCISQGERNCPFLMFTGLPWEHDGDDEIGLTAKEGRRLQNVHHRRHFIERRVLVHVGEHRHADLLAHLRESLQASLEPRTAEARARGTIRLVERSLEDEGNIERGGHFLEASGHVDDQRLALDDAGTGNQEERAIGPDLEGRQLHSALESCGGAARLQRGPIFARRAVRTP